MNFQDLMNVADTTKNLNGIVLYVIAGIGALFLILFLVWLLFKLSSFIKRRKNHETKKEISDEEQLFGD